MKDHKPSSILGLWKSGEEVLNSHVAHWKQISEISSPIAIRSIEEAPEQTRLSKINERRNIFNDTIAQAHKVSTAGFMAGITPSESPWFVSGLAVNGRHIGLNDVYPEVKQLIDYRTEVARTTLYDSNFYSVIPELYGDGLMFANGAILMDESEKLDGSLNFEYMPLGTFQPIDDALGRTIGFIRRLNYTTVQLVKAFIKRPDGTYDWEKAPADVKVQWDNGEYYRMHTVYHGVLPALSMDTKHPWRSYYLLRDNHQEKYLRQGKYSYFPCYFFRWSKRQGEPFGIDSPGMTIYNSNEYLQILEKGAMFGYKQKADPTLKVTPDVDLAKYNRSKHGGYVVVPDMKEGAGVEPLFGGMMYPFSEVEAKIERLENRIRQGFYNDMFMAFLNTSRTEKTREEIIKKYEEKLIMIAPTVGRVKNDVLSPLMKDVLMIQERAGKIPTADDIKEVLSRQSNTNLRGSKVSVLPVYTSLLMQAMKLLGLDNFNNFLGTVGALAQAKQAEGSTDSPWDWIDMDKLTLGMAEKYYIPSDFLMHKMKVDEIREQRQQAIAQERQAQMANVEADTVNTIIKAGAQTGGIV